MRSTSTQSPAEILEDVVWQHRNTRVAPKTVNQKRYVDAIRRNTITFGIGPAGTGKTYLAVAMAVARSVARRGQPRSSSPGPRSRPASASASCPATCRRRSTRTCGRSTTRSTTCSRPRRSTRSSSGAIIEVAPLAFMRGRTLNDAFIILDEAQNTTPRADEDVPDPPRLQLARWSSPATSRRSTCREPRPGSSRSGQILTGRRGHRFVHFGGEDVVRHKLVQRIVTAYGEPTAKPPTKADDERLISTYQTSRMTCATAGAATLHAPASDDGHLRRARWRRARRRSSTAAPRRDEPTDVACVPNRRPAARHGATRARGRLHLPGEGERRDRGGGARHLHLCGFDHDTDGGEMLELQAKVMASVREGSRDGEGADSGTRVGGATSLMTAGEARRPGASNVGKSTLVNAIVWTSSALRQRVARSGVCDGPGRRLAARHDRSSGGAAPRDALTERMQRRVEREIADADAVLLVVNADTGVWGPATGLSPTRCSAPTRRGRRPSSAPVISSSTNADQRERRRTAVVLETASRLDGVEEIFPSARRKAGTASTR